MAADSGATTALPDEVKKNLKSIVLELRHLFEGDLGLGLKRLGIDVETGKVTPADEPALSYLTAEERETRSSLDAVLAKEAAMTKDVPEAVRALLREAAYTHLNRLIGLKCLELRGHLAIDGERTEIVTQRSDYGDLSKYLWTLRSRDARLLGDPELLWREGLVRACSAASAELGVLFDPADPYAQVWPSHKALVQAVRTLDELPESAFRADELLGWVYQYFQSEEKDRVFAEVRTKKKKIAWADIVPVTQLYTERYMVDFLLQNSIGARWMEMYPDSRAKEAWLYYVEPATPHAREPQAVKEWTLLDPCCGSGHFLVVAFDLLVQLYAEERAFAEQGLVPAEWAVPEAEVAHTILERNLHGIDIDPRAVQLSALALYLKAKDLGLDGTPQMHLVIADCVLQRGADFQALLGTYKGDGPATEAIEAIWSALEHVRDLGSLVRIEEEVEAAVQLARRRSAGSFSELTDWAAYKSELVARLKNAFAAEASSRDERQRVFGTEAEKGLGLLEVLSARYDVVCTNPPYMGVRGMAPVMSDYIRQHYYPGRNDLYAAFILRCLELSKANSPVAMVTQQSWMFLNAFAALRGGHPVEEGGGDGPESCGLLRGCRFACLAHLGGSAFSEVSGEVVSVVLAVFSRATPQAHHQFSACRLTGVAGSLRKASALITSVRAGQFLRVGQMDLLNIPGAAMAYWLSPRLLHLISANQQVGAQVRASGGVGTRDENRFLRKFWETPSDAAWWMPYAKGGGYQKWCGLLENVVDWENSGSRVRESIIRKYPYLKGNTGFLIRDEDLIGEPGLTYTDFASGCFSCRHVSGAIVSDGGPGLFARSVPLDGLAAWLNSRAFTYLLRSVSPSFNHFGWGYVMSMPMLSLPALQTLAELASMSTQLKASLLAGCPTDRAFSACVREKHSGCVTAGSTSPVETLLSTLEGMIEALVCGFLELGESDIEAVTADTGTPAGWYPLVAGRDTLPELPIGIPGPPDGLAAYLQAHERLELSPSGLEDLKTDLRIHYAAGPGAKAQPQEDDATGDAGGPTSFGARVPMPPETFIDELSQKLGIHPISVYRLLEELREEEGVVCPPEKKVEAEDLLSVKLLRMLGHRWPMQDQYEQDEGRSYLHPAWIDVDGLIALTIGLGEETLAARLRGVFDDEFGSDNGHQVELEVAHALGWKPGTEWGKQKPLPVGDWFKRDFFRRHVSQFKRRPIAWHLKSPKGTVQVIVYYHAFNRDRLALLRARYLGHLRQELNSSLAAATAKGYDDRANMARVEELEEQLVDLDAFDANLARLQEGREREARIWCPWKTPEEQPQGWDPDINDGVRINIAPLQRLGLLASDVLNKKDLSSLLAPEGRG